jgi:hypothetical protein
MSSLLGYVSCGFVSSPAIYDYYEYMSSAIIRNNHNTPPLKPIRSIRNKEKPPEKTTAGAALARGLRDQGQDFTCRAAACINLAGNAATGGMPPWAPHIMIAW